MNRQRSFLSIADFDPLAVDISFLDEVTDNFPVQGSMDLPMAEEFATATLKAADHCTDLLAQSIVYLGHCDTEKRAARSRAIRDSLANKFASTVAKDISQDDEAYILAENVYNVALAWNTWLQGKNDALIKMHHLCKDFLKNTEMLKGASGWQPIETPTRKYRSEPESESVDEAPVPPKKQSSTSSPWKV